MAIRELVDKSQSLNVCIASHLRSAFNKYSRAGCEQKCINHPTCRNRIRNAMLYHRNADKTSGCNNFQLSCIYLLAHLTSLHSAINSSSIKKIIKEEWGSNALLISVDCVMAISREE